MIISVIGLCLISGGVKGTVDNIFKPKPSRLLREHTTINL